MLLDIKILYNFFIKTFQNLIYGFLHFVSWCSNERSCRSTRIEGKLNRYVIIDDEPCKIVSITTSKPGKHGEAKARIEAIGVFDNQKRSIVSPVRHKVNIPIIDKRTAQVISIMGDKVQLMDMETYETFNMDIPEEFKGKIENGKEIQYLQALGKRKITRV
ncbi:MAG: translation initiation factor IF-5A [Thermoplasmata archaeon]|nr:MAG: translation initiation factor IF-5A [Thermoplasmata archaeon]